MNYEHAKSQAGGRMTQFFYEYLFHQAIDEINNKRSQEYADSLNKSDSVIVVSKAKRLRQAVLDELDAADFDFTDAPVTDFRDALNAVLAPENNGQPIFSDDDTGKRKYSKMFTDFAKMTCFKEIQGGRNIEDAIIPLSPYDSRFANRTVFMKNGSKLLYMDRENINLSTGRLQHTDNPVVYVNDFRGNLTEAGEFTTQDDKSGMARLLRFIPQKDYAALADWVNSAPEEMYMSPASVSRSVAVLQYLQDNGYEYEIKKDRHYGQLKAEIKGTKMNVRIADTRNNENYVGSIYDDGRRIYFATTPSQQKPQINIQPTDCVNLLKFALGESIERQDIKQPVGAYGTYQSGKYPRPNSYHTDKGGYSAIYKSIKDSNGRDMFDKMTIHIDNKRENANLRFEDGQQAEEYLRSSIHSAKEHFKEMLNVDYLVDEARKHQDDDDYVPQLSGDIGIAAIQQSYWEILTGKQTELIKAGSTMEDYESLGQNSFDPAMADYLLYQGTPEEKVRQHLIDIADNVIGDYDLGDDGTRFNPANVAKYMVSGNGVYRNNDNIITALKAVNMDVDELRGSEYSTNQIKNRLIKFNKDTATPMYQSSNEFVQGIFSVIKTTLAETGCDVKDQDILMDDNGIVHYEGTRTKNWRNPVQEPITGEIGQIFVPDGLGMIRTQFASGDDYIFVPGYNATVVPQKDGENLSLEERTRLHGYEQEMRKSIAYQIRSDLMNNGNSFGEPTSVNNVHHRMYGTRYPVDVIERAVAVDGMRKDVFDAIIQTLSRRVRYSNDFKENSTINADFQANRNMEFNDIANDNYADAYRLSGRRNMSVMTEDAFGYFDPHATSTATNQGIVRFLTEDAKVDSDGKIIKGDENGRTPLMKIDEMRYIDYSPFDRVQMVFSNMLTARAIANDVHTAQMTFGGWTFDDGYVVSKEFAEKYQIRGADGKVRPMTKGDKICDFGGNKGVIGLIVDPDMDLEEARAQGIEEPVKWFKANKENGNRLDVVGAPFTAVSRFNATSDKMLMEHPMDLIGPDGKVYEGCMGSTSFIITDKTVDEKTHNYGDEEMAEGKGRKASSQLAWVLAAQDATAVLDEYYSSNSTATANFREMLITMGLDMSETGQLRDHYEPHEGEKRMVFEMPELEYRETKNGRYLNVTKMRQDFGNIIQDTGGILELPFPLKYPSGGFTPPLNDGKTNVVYTQTEWERKGYYRKDGTYVKPTTVRRHEDANTKRAGGMITYGLPILSSYLRSGQEFEDGTASRHDYTNNYQSIYEASLRYRDELAKGDACDEQKLNQYINEAQRSYNQITMDLQMRKFDNSKRNTFKDDLMSHRLAHSATAVWTADPRLDLDQIAVGTETARVLGVKDNDRIILWRDPMLRDAGLKYLRIKIDDSLTGCAVNPAIDEMFDGDYDGDSVGVNNPQMKRARREAYIKLSLESNMLNRGIINVDENGKESYPLLFQKGLDLASCYYDNPDLADQRKELEARVNELESNKDMDIKQLMNARKKLLKEVSDHIKNTFSKAYGTDMLCYKDAKSHLKSIAHTVENGSKGSWKKLADYMKYIGWQADMIKDADGKIVGVDFDTLKDTGHTLSTYDDDMDTMYATAIKSFGTGVAGKYSQRGIAALRETCAKAVLENTYINTQGILQAKHDPIDARNRYEMLMGCVRDLWRGYKLESEVNSDGKTKWKVARDPYTKATSQASPEEFKEQFLEIYGPKGLDCSVNEHYVDDIAKALTDPVSGKIMNMEEQRIPNASTLDRLTYGGGFKGLVEAAQNNENLFDGKYTSHFAPSSIRRNILAKAETSSGKTVKAILKSDVKETTELKKYKTLEAVAFSKRRTPETPEVQDKTDETVCAF